VFILLLESAFVNTGSKTAEYLGVSRRYLQYKIKEYHIQSRCHYDGGTAWVDVNSMKQETET
jgi:hypothetical protein